MASSTLLRRNTPRVESPGFFNAQNRPGKQPLMTFHVQDMRRQRLRSTFSGVSLISFRQHHPCGAGGHGHRSWASGVSRQAGQTPPDWVPETRWLPPSSSQHGPLSSLFPTLRSSGLLWLCSKPSWLSCARRTLLRYRSQHHPFKSHHQQAWAMLPLSAEGAGPHLS